MDEEQYQRYLDAQEAKEQIAEERESYEPKPWSIGKSEMTDRSRRKTYDDIYTFE